MIGGEGTVVVLVLAIIVVAAAVMFMVGAAVGGPAGPIPSVLLPAVTVRTWTCHCGGKHPDWEYHTDIGCARTEAGLCRARDRFARMKLERGDG